jgi:hypothetical protein
MAYIRKTSTYKGRGQSRDRCPKCGRRGLGPMKTYPEAKIIWPVHKCRYCLCYTDAQRELLDTNVSSKEHAARLLAKKQQRLKDLEAQLERLKLDLVVARVEFTKAINLYDSVGQ